MHLYVQPFRPISAISRSRSAAGSSDAVQVITAATGHGVSLGDHGQHLRQQQSQFRAEPSPGPSRWCGGPIIGTDAESLFTTTCTDAETLFTTTWTRAES